MATFERSWKLSDADTSFGMENGEFTLEKRLHDGVVYYAMTKLVCAEEEFDTWADCRLVRRGRFVHPWEGASLVPGAAGNAARIGEWLKKSTAATLRLEGDIEIMEAGAAASSNTIVGTQAVTIFVVREAVKVVGGEPRDLLILQAHGVTTGMSIAGGADGSITGDPNDG